jgi:hypothetical protein
MNRLGKIGLEAGQYGCGCTMAMGASAPLLGHLESNFVKGSSLIFYSGPVLVFYEDEMVWLEFGLVLHPFGPDFAGCEPLFSFAMCRMEMCFA